jgi:Tfp pilus assembly protein PilX
MVRRRPTGHALLVALIILLLVASAATTVALHFGFRARLASQESRRIHLVAMSDAAVAGSLARLHQSSGYSGLPEQDFDGGRISSTISSHSGNRRQILAVAHYRGWERKVKVRVRIVTGGLELESWGTLPPGAH